MTKPKLERLTHDIETKSNVPDSLPGEHDQAVRTRSTKSLNDTRQRRHEKKIYKGKLKTKICEYPSCGQVFKSSQELTNHINRHHTKFKPYLCAICVPEWRAVTAYELTRHMAYRHTKERRFKCSTCNKEFIERCKLLRHSKIHKQPDFYYCSHDKCKKRFRTAVRLEQHMAKKHDCQLPIVQRTGSQSETYTCGICTDTIRRYSSKSALAVHVKRKHTTDTTPGPGLPPATKKARQDRDSNISSSSRRILRSSQDASVQDLTHVPAEN